MEITAGLDRATGPHPRPAALVRTTPRAAPAVTTVVRAPDDRQNVIFTPAAARRLGATMLGPAVGAAPESELRAIWEELAPLTDLAGLATPQLSRGVALAVDVVDLPEDVSSALGGDLGMRLEGAADVAATLSRAASLAGGFGAVPLGHDIADGLGVVSLVLDLGGTLHEIRQTGSFDLAHGLELTRAAAKVVRLGLEHIPALQGLPGAGAAGAIARVIEATGPVLRDALAEPESRPAGA